MWSSRFLAISRPIAATCTASRRASPCSWTRARTTGGWSGWAARWARTRPEDRGLTWDKIPILSLISNPSRCSVGDSRTCGRGGCPAGGLELRQIGQRALKLVLEVADPQEAADPAQELDLVDGLGQEVVGPGLHATLEIRGFVERGDHQDQEVLGGGVGADLAAHLEARKPWHHDVQEEEVGLKLLDHAERFLTVIRRAEHAVEIAEIRFEQLHVLRVIVSDEDFRDRSGLVQGQPSSRNQPASEIPKGRE